MSKFVTLSDSVIVLKSFSLIYIAMGVYLNEASSKIEFTKMLVLFKNLEFKPPRKV